MKLHGKRLHGTKAAARLALSAAVLAAVMGAGGMPAFATDIATVESAVSGQAVSFGGTSDPTAVITAILSQGGGNKVGTLTYNNWAFLVNDGSGSIDVFGAIPAGYTPTVGDAVAVSGSYSPYSQIQEVGSVTSITQVSTGNATPAPLKETIPQVNVTTLPTTISAYYVELDNVTISGFTGSTFGTSNVTATITDGSGNHMTLYYWPTSYSISNTNFATTTVPTTPVSILGIVDVYNNSAPEFIPIAFVSSGSSANPADRIFQGASLTWDATTATNWQNPSTLTIGAWSDTGAAVNAVFNGSDGATSPVTVTLAGPRTADGLSFSKSVYILNGQTITLGSGAASANNAGATACGIIANESATINSGLILSASQTWSVAAAKTLTIAGNISETTGGTTLTFIGTGTTVLSGTNTYTGATTISAGAVQFNSPSAIAGTGGNVMVAANAAAAAGYALDQAFLNRINTSSAGTAALTMDSAAALNFSAFSTLSLGAIAGTTPTFTGTLTPNGNTYRLGGGGGTLTFAPTITGSAAVTISGPGAVVLASTSNSFTGNVTLAGGSLMVSNGAQLGQTATINFTGGTLAAGAPMTISRTLNLISNGTIDTAGFNVSVVGAINGSGALTKAGLGTLDLTTSNPNYNSLTIAKGIVLANSPTQVGATTSPITFTGGTLQLLPGYAQQDQSEDNADYHDFVFGTGGGTLLISKVSGVDPEFTLAITNAGGFESSNGQITGSGSVTKDGDGTLILETTGSPTPPPPVSAFTGTAYINAGMIKIIGSDTSNQSPLYGGNIDVNASPSGSGLTAAGGILQLGDDSSGTGVTLGSATVANSVGYIDLYDGGTLQVVGNTILTHAVTYSSKTVLTSSVSAVKGSVTHANQVYLTALAGATLTLASSVGQYDPSAAYSGASDAVIHLPGPGTVILAYGSAPANNAKYMYAGDWSLEGGTLEIDQSGSAFNALLSLGYQNGDTTTAGSSTMTISGSGVLRLTSNTDPTNANALSALPTAVVLSGGAIAGSGAALGSNGARFGGAFTLSSSGGSVLTYDPAHPAVAENVVLVGSGAADWEGTLTVNQGTGGASGGKLIIASTGTATVAAGAQVTVPASSAVELRGTTVLYDQTAERGVAFAVAGKLTVTSGANQIGAISGAGMVNVAGAGSSLTADSVTGNPVSLSTGGVLSLSQKTLPGSAVSEIPLPSVAAGSHLYVTDNPLIVQGSSASAVNGLLSSAALASSSSAGAPALTAVTGAQFHDILGPSATLDGSAVGATDVLVLWKADVNMDGIVDLPDLMWLDAAYLGVATPFSVDLTGDGKVNAADYAAMYAALQAEGSTQLAAQTYADGVSLFGETFQASVPEPAALSVLCLGAAALLFRRRR